MDQMNPPPWLQQQTYSGQNDDQVDWAQLAQQWIAMKSAQEEMVQESQASSESSDHAEGDSSKNADDKGSVSEDQAAWQQQGDYSMYDQYMWATANNQWPVVGGATDYGGYYDPSYYGTEPGADSSTYGVHPGSYWPHVPGMDGSQNGSGDTPYGSYPGSEDYHRDRRHDRSSRHRERRRSREPPPHVGVVQPTFDRKQRKMLPAWIREGLEKVEREKQKQEDEERKKLEEQSKKDDKMNRNSDEPTKSKFDSDSESEIEQAPSPVPAPQRSRSPSPDGEQVNAFEPERSVEERKADILVLLRRLLTEMLMDVTTDQIEEVCKSTLGEYKNKAPARVLAKSSALAALSGLGEDEDTPDEGPNQGQSDSEAEARPPSPDSGNDERISKNPQKEPSAPTPRSPPASYSRADKSGRTSRKSRRSRSKSRSRSRSDSDTDRRRKSRKSKSKRSPKTKRRHRSRSRSRSHHRKPKKSSTKSKKRKSRSPSPSRKRRRRASSSSS